MGIGGTVRLRAKIIEYLKGKPRTSNEIRDHINSITAYGTTAGELNNVLGKDPRFVNIGTTQDIALDGRAYVISVWELNETNPIEE